MGILDRDRLLAEVADLRDRVDYLQEENRLLREAMTPAVPFPAHWHLTAQESQALHALNRLQGRVLSKERMMVWLYGFGAEVEIKIVDVLVCKIRRKLKPFGVVISTQWGEGYALERASLQILAAALEPVLNAALPPEARAA